MPNRTRARHGTVSPRPTERRCHDCEEFKPIGKFTHSKLARRCDACWSLKNERDGDQAAKGLTGWMAQNRVAASQRERT